MAMKYTTYEYKGAKIVTINYNGIGADAELYAARKHLERRGFNQGLYGKRLIFSDNGDRSRFEAFEQAVKDARMKKRPAPAKGE